MENHVIPIFRHKLKNDIMVVYFQAFGEAHEESAQEGQTTAPDRDDKVDLHFIAFVHKNGKLYELGKWCR